MGKKTDDNEKKERKFRHSWVFLHLYIPVWCYLKWGMWMAAATLSSRRRF